MERTHKCEGHGKCMEVLVGKEEKWEAYDSSDGEAIMYKKGETEASCEGPAGLGLGLSSGCAFPFWEG